MQVVNMKFSVGKKGLSEVVSTILLIMLSIVAISIIAFFIFNSIKPSLSPAVSCVEMKLKPLVKIENACYNSTSGDVQVSLTRSLDNKNLDSINFGLTFSGGSYNYLCGGTCSNCIVLDKSATKVYYFKTDKQVDKAYVKINDCILNDVDVGIC